MQWTPDIMLKLSGGAVYMWQGNFPSQIDVIVASPKGILKYSEWWGNKYQKIVKYVIFQKFP